MKKQSVNGPAIVLVDLFSGTGGFALAFEKAGFNIVQHYYSEINKHAIANYQYNFKKAQHIGCIESTVRAAKRIVAAAAGAIIVVTFGSPCQVLGINFIQFQQILKDTNSKIFFHTDKNEYYE